MREHRRVRVAGGRVEAVYGEAMLPEILGALAARPRWRVERASEVEWEWGLWVARLARPLRGSEAGTIIALGPDREQVIREEVAWLQG